MPDDLTTWDGWVAAHGLTSSEEDAFLDYVLAQDWDPDQMTATKLDKAWLAFQQGMQP
jgi:hypothetical protein